MRRGVKILTLPLALALALLLPASGSFLAQGEPTPAMPGTTPRATPPQNPGVTTVEPQEPGAAVLFEGKTLFRLHARLGPFSPEDRAAAIAERLARLSKGPRSSLDAISVADGDGVAEILSGDRVLLSITDADAAYSGKPRLTLAKDYAAAIKEVVGQSQHARSLKSLMIDLLFTALATAVLVLILMGFKTLFPKSYAWLESSRGTRLRSWRLQKVELLSADKITDFLKWGARGARSILTLVVLFIYLSLVFSFFPWTRGIASELFGYLNSTLGAMGRTAVSYLPNLAFIAIVVVLTRYVIKFIHFLFSEVGKGTLTLPNFKPYWADPTYKIVRFLILVFAAIVIFPYLPGSSSPAFRGISLFLGALVTLGSSSAIANVVAGVVLTYTNAFQIGDRVKIADTMGDVVEQTLLVTRVRTIKNVDITIPNAMVLGSHIVNFSSSCKEWGLILHTTVTIGYDVPWRQVHELLIAAADATEHIFEKPEPFVLQVSLDDFFVAYELNAYTEAPHLMALTYSELHQNIQDKFNEAGVEIMSPHYSSLRDGNATAIPQDYLPKHYDAPGFKISSLLAPKTRGKGPVNSQE